MASAISSGVMSGSIIGFPSRCGWCGGFLTEAVPRERVTAAQHFSSNAQAVWCGDRRQPPVPILVGSGAGDGDASRWWDERGQVVGGCLTGCGVVFWRVDPVDAEVLRRGDVVSEVDVDDDGVAVDDSVDCSGVDVRGHGFTSCQNPAASSAAFIDVVNARLV